jgi:4-hydroxybenzoate polyprenyltransferase
MRRAKKLIVLMRLVRFPWWLLLAINSVILIVTFQGGIYNAELMGLTFIIWATISAGGFAMNDYFDRKSDAIVHPERPITSNQISATRAVQISVLLFLVGLGVALTINLLALEVVGAVTIFLLLYSAFFKRLSVLLSHIVIGLVEGLALPLFSEAAVSEIISIVALSFIGFSLWGIGRNVLKDVTGLEGDLKIGYSTLPAKLGINTAAKIGALLCFFAPIALTMPYVVGLVSSAYLIPLALWGGIQSYASLSIFKKPDVENVKRLHKIVGAGTLLLPIALLSGTFLLR